MIDKEIATCATYGKPDLTNEYLIGYMRGLQSIKWEVVKMRGRE